jgi:hypothetical protein
VAVLWTHSILYVRPKSALGQGDVLALAKTVDPYIGESGELAGLIVDAPAFPGRRIRGRKAMGLEAPLSRLTLRPARRLTAARLAADGAGR